MSTSGVTHRGEHPGLEGRHGQVLSLPGLALGAGGHGLHFRPLAGGAALEGGAVDAVPETLLVTGAGEAALGGARGGRGRGGRLGLSGLSGGGRGARGRFGGSKDARSGSLGRTTAGLGGLGSAAGVGATAGVGTTAGTTRAGALGVAGAAEGRSAAAGLRALGGEVAGVAGIVDVLTGVGEADVDALLGGAAVDVGDEHGGEVGRALLDVALLLNIALGGAAALDGDGGTVHVHLTVADAVEPGPGEGVLAFFDTLGNLVGQRAFGAGAALGEVAVHVRGAATLDRLDDHPLGVLGGLEILGQTDLAGTATVDGGTGEAQGHGLADLGDSLLIGSIVDTAALLAGEVTAIGQQRRVVEGGLAVGSRLGHDHVSVDGGSAEQNGGKTSLVEHSAGCIF